MAAYGRSEQTLTPPKCPGAGTAPANQTCYGLIETDALRTRYLWNNSAMAISCEDPKSLICAQIEPNGTIINLRRSIERRRRVAVIFWNSFVNQTERLPDLSAESDILAKKVSELRTKVEELAEATGLIRRRDAERPSPERDLIRSILVLRSKRECVFGKAIFGEPSWDMLLELYDAELRGKKESISSLCYASGSSPTTALRHLHVLETEGWVERAADPTDKRRFFIALTPKASDAMVALFGGSELSIAA